MIVKISDVAMLLYSPVFKAATASAEAVSAAISNRTHPKKRPKNIFNLLFRYMFFISKLKYIIKKKIKGKKKKQFFEAKNKKNVVF